MILFNILLKSTFFSFICDRFLAISHFKYANIRCWWFSLSEDNRRTKYLVHPKILPADVCVFGHSGWHLAAAVHSVDCQFDSGLKWWIHFWSMLHICAKPFLLLWNSCKQRAKSSTRCCFWSTVSKRSTLLAFSLKNVHTKSWIHFLISSTHLLSHAKSIYDRSNVVFCVCWCFPGQLPKLVVWVFSIICVCTAAFR